MTLTHTYATLEVPSELYKLVRTKLIEAGYHHLIGEAGEPLDMTGIALVPPTDEPADYCINKNESKAVRAICNAERRCPQMVFPTGTCREQEHILDYLPKYKWVQELYRLHKWEKYGY